MSGMVWFVIDGKFVKGGGVERRCLRRGWGWEVRIVLVVDGGWGEGWCEWWMLVVWWWKIVISKSLVKIGREGRDDIYCW